MQDLQNWGVHKRMDVHCPSTRVGSKIRAVLWPQKLDQFSLRFFYLRGVVSLTRVLVSVPRGVASRPRLLEADSYLIMMFRYEFEFWNQRRI